MPGKMCTSTFGIFAGTGFLFSSMPKGFLPSDDVGQLFVITEAAQDISFDAMANLQQQVSTIVRKNPYVENVMTFAGAGGPTGSLNNGRLFVTNEVSLTSTDGRTVSATLNLDAFVYGAGLPAVAPSVGPTGAAGTTTTASTG